MRTIVSLQAVVAVAAVVGILRIQHAKADRLRPVRGTVNFSVFLCKFKGQPAPPNDVEHYEDLFFGGRMDSLGDYLFNMSSKSVRTDGVVKGWYELNETLNEGWRRGYDLCVAAAREVSEYNPPDDHVKVVVAYPTVYATQPFGSDGRVLLDWNATLGDFQQLTLSSMGLNPSFSNFSSWCYFDSAERGAYGDLWDVMSFMHTHNWETSRFSLSGPGMNAYNLDRMGWVPMNRILRFGSDGVYDAVVNLTTLSDPKGPGTGYMMVRIPIDPADKQHYYIVEYRTPTKWDRSVGERKVLIHEVATRSEKRCDTNETTGYKQRSYVLVKGSRGIESVESLSRNGVTIRVVSKGKTQARVRIRSTNRGWVPSYGPNTCRSGYVWRQGDGKDYVCTTASRRTAVKTENSLAASRRDPNGGPYGADTCKQGFVWRSAWPEDRVCVVPSSRTKAAKENNAAYSLLAFPS